MIYYLTDAWVQQIFRYHGTIWGQVKWTFVMMLVYAATSYWWCASEASNLGRMRKNILGSTVSFLLVFRANNAYKRYWEGKLALTHFFWAVRELVCTYLVFMPGGSRNRCLRWRLHAPGAAQVFVRPGEEKPPDDDDLIISEERLHALRWILIMAISLQLHTRLLDEGLQKGSLTRDTKALVDWDRYRIRGLTNEREFKLLDHYVRNMALNVSDWDQPDLTTLPDSRTLFGDVFSPPDGPDEIEINTAPACRLLTIVAYKVNEVAWRNMKEARSEDKKYGIMERFVPIITGLTFEVSHLYGQVVQIVTTPLPFPYSQLCRTLLFLYFLSFPFFIEQELGPWANVCEFAFLSLALLGVDTIATELENPFGDDVNDLSMWDKIAALEQEIMFFLRHAGDESCESNFIWQEMPAGLCDHSVPPVKQYLALRSQVASRGKVDDVIYGGGVDRTDLWEDLRDLRDEDEDASNFSDDS